MSLPLTEPDLVAISFYEVMFKYDNLLSELDLQTNPPNNNTDISSGAPELIDNPVDDVSPTPIDITSPLTLPKFLDNFPHVLQFCHLCFKRKIQPVLYTFDTSLETRNWYMKPDSTSDDEQADIPESIIS
jgi:hypothetical protein